MLVDHREAFGDHAIDGHDVAGVNDDDVAPAKVDHGHLHLDAFLDNPDKARLLTEDVEEHPLRAVLRALDQRAAEREAPAEHRPGKYLQRTEAADDDDDVEHVAADASLLEQKLVGTAEHGCRCVQEKCRGGHEQWRKGELSRRRQRQRNGAQREIEVEFVELAGDRNTRQHSVENFHDLRAGQLPRVEVDAHRRKQRARGELVDAEHAHQFPLDRLGEFAPAVEGGMPYLDVPETLTDDAPSRHDLTVTLKADEPPTAPGERSRWDHRGVFSGRPSLLEQAGQPRQEVARCGPSRVILDHGPARRSLVDRDPLDLFQGEGAREEPAAGLGVAIGEHRSRHMNLAGSREDDGDVHGGSGETPCQ